MTTSQEPTLQGVWIDTLQSQSPVGAHHSSLQEFINYLASLEHFLGRFVKLYELLARWNQRFDLVADATVSSFVHKHLLDCLSLAWYLEKKSPSFLLLANKSPPLHCADIGSGAGFPGVILALIFPQAQWTLVEPNNKRVAFLRQVKIELSLENITLFQGRIENFPLCEKNYKIGSENKSTEVAAVPFDWVFCRAFAPLNAFISMVAPITHPKGSIIAMKSRLKPDEFNGLPNMWGIEDCVLLPVLADLSDKISKNQTHEKELATGAFEVFRQLVLVKRQPIKTADFSV